MQATQSRQLTARPGASDESAEALRQVASALLLQAVELLAQFEAMGKEEGQRILSYESKLIPGSTIGKHFRHSLDHYRLLLESVPSSATAAAPLEVNYDVRTRLLDMERDPAVAKKSFEEMDARLSSAVQKTEMGKQVALTALTPHHQELESSFGRELWFVALHAIHHYSLLRVIATGELNLKLPDSFGVAPSTLAYREVGKEFSEQEKKQAADSPQKLEQAAEKMASKVKL